MSTYKVSYDFLPWSNVVTKLLFNRDFDQWRPISGHYNLHEIATRIY